MSHKKEFNPEKISIIEFKFIKGQVNNPENFDSQQIQNYSIDNTLKFGFNIEEKLIKTDFITHIETNSNGNNNGEASGDFHFVFIYEIENLQDLIEIKDDETIKVHPSLDNAISSLTYSTSRGVLMTRLQGTALQNFILPVVNPNTLMGKKE